MKRACITFLSLGIILLTAVAFFYNKPVEKQGYLRIHIRANSNCEVDQQVKYKVKERVVTFLTPFVAECQTVERAKEMLQNKIPEIEKVANSVLQENGFNYFSKAKLKTEEFPTRVYQDLTLESGFYDALIISLGEGTGDNWWCVVYPPLCFVGEGNSFVYKSKIKQIINDFFK